MHIAARTKDGEKVAEMLIKSGADVNAPSDVRNSYSPRDLQLFETKRSAYNRYLQVSSVSLFSPTDVQIVRLLQLALLSVSQQTVLIRPCC